MKSIKHITKICLPSSKMNTFHHFGIFVLDTDLYCLKVRALKLINSAGVAQWTECRPANQRVAGSSPSQGTWLRCKPGPGGGGVGGAGERQPHSDVSPSLSPSSLKINKISKE